MMDNLIIPQTILNSKPSTGIIIRAEKMITSQDRHGVRIEAINPDIEDMLEQIGFDSIFDYWSVEMIQKEVERYVRKQNPQ